MRSKVSLTPNTIKDTILDNLDVYWYQIVRPFKPCKERNWLQRSFRRVVIADLKNKSNEETDKTWRLITSFREFKNYAIKQLSSVKGVPGVYVSKERMYAGEIQFIDFVLDVDRKENPDLNLAYNAVIFLNNKLLVEGIKLLWVISGNGLHGHLDTTPLYYRLSLEEYSKLLPKLNEKYAYLTRFLEEYLESKGFKVRFDRAIYSSRRLFRAVNSPHEVKKIFSIPVDFTLSLEENLDRARKSGKPLKLRWGELRDVRGFLKLLELADLIKLAEEAGKKKELERRVRRPKHIKGVRRGVAALIDEAKTRDLTHQERLAILLELINNNWSDEAIIDVFRNQSDFDPEKIRYFIDHAKRRQYKPFKTENLRRILEEDLIAKGGEDG